MTTTQPTPNLCWNPDNLPKAISLQAKVDRKQSHYFLACHSPVERIRDERLKQELSEEGLYQRIMNRRTQRDFLGLVHGDSTVKRSLARLAGRKLLRSSRCRPAGYTRPDAG